MARLVSPSSPSSLKNLKPSTFLTPTNRFNSARFNFSPSTCSDLRRVSSISYESHSLNLISNRAFQKPKVITARTLAILFALVLILIQPAIAPAAFATFQTAAKTSSPAVAAVGGKLIRT